MNIRLTGIIIMCTFIPTKINAAASYSMSTVWAACASRADKTSKLKVPGHRFCVSYLKQNQCQLASLKENCLSKHILLPNFCCSVAVASRCVWSVPFPELAYNRSPAPPVQDAACGKERTPQPPVFNTSRVFHAAAVSRAFSLQYIFILHSSSAALS